MREGEERIVLYERDEMLKQIEALQQEIEQLQAECNAWKQSAEIAEKLALDAQAQVARMREAVEVLETVTEHLENCYGRNTPDTEKAREVLAAIDKMGGREDV